MRKCRIWRTKLWKNEELKKCGGSTAKAKGVWIWKSVEIVQSKDRSRV